MLFFTYDINWSGHNEGGVYRIRHFLDFYSVSAQFPKWDFFDIQNLFLEYNINHEKLQNECFLAFITSIYTNDRRYTTNFCPSQLFKKIDFMFSQTITLWYFHI